MNLLLEGNLKMALGMWCQCQCGAHLRAYLPKKKLFSPLTGRWVDWEKIDGREEGEGDIIKIQQFAKYMGQIFVDLRKSDSALCPTCGEKVDLMEKFQRQMWGPPHLEPQGGHDKAA